MKLQTKNYKLLANFGLGQEKEYFTEELSLLISSGMTISSSLSAIKEEIKSKRLKTIIEGIAQAIDDGTPISAALKASGIFAEHAISLIKIGEESGRLSENLKVVALEEQKDREFRSKIASATMYPVFVFGLTTVVGIGISWFILPRLATVFAGLRIDLPLITKILIALGSFLGKYGAIVIPSFLLTIFLFLFFIFFSPKTKFIGQAILFTIAPFRKLMVEAELARCGYIFGNLLSAGLPVIDTVSSLKEASSLYRYKKFYGFLEDKITEGNSFQKCFSLYPKINKLIPVPIQQLIVSSEQSGNLPETLIKIGEIYERKTENTTKNLSVLLEPILLVIVWLGVVAVALAVILPLYSLIGNLNTSGSVPVPLTQQAIVSPSPVPAPSLKILETGLGYLNIRIEPSLTAEIVGKAKPGDIFDYLQKQGEWYQIEYGVDSRGWVFGDYVELVSSE